MNKTFGLSRHLQLCAYLYGEHFKQKTPILDGDCIALAGMWHLPVLDFDLAALKGKRIDRAVLHMQAASASPLLEVDMTSVSQQWDKEYATYYASSSGKPWAGGIASEVLLGRGNSVFFRERVECGPAGGMLSVPVRPALVYAMANGQSFGIGLLDAKSRAYAVTAEDKWAHEDWLAVKKININPAVGATPCLEVEYDDQELGSPPPAGDFHALGIVDEESFEHARAVLHWSVEPYDGGEYRYYRIACCETGSADGQMTDIEKYMVPNYDGGSGFQTAEVGPLKPDTDYTFSIVVGNGCAESEPVYARARMPAAQQRPVLPACIAEASGSGCPSALNVSGFTVHVADDIRKVNPITGRVFEEAGDAFETAGPNGIEHLKHGDYDGKRLSLDCSPGERLGFQLIVENKSEADSRYQMEITGNSLGERAVRINKVWYINCAHGWFPEVAVPMEPAGSFAIPFSENKIPGQRFQSIFIDVEIPENLLAGQYGFTVAISSGGEPAALPVDIRVRALRLDAPDFVFDLNGYIAAPEYMGAKYGSPGFSGIEQTYYTEAWRHGLAINIVPYDQRGRMQAGFAPKVEIVGGSPRVTDWSQWDDHFGKYLDGSYLKESCGRKIPIRHMYLPIHENWPLKIADYYKPSAARSDFPELVNELKLRTSTVAADFLPGYFEGIREVFKDFIRHADDMGWGGVTFQFYLNNKNFYKEPGFMGNHGMTPESHWLVDRTIGNDGEGSSWWLLDEPNFRDDFEALACFARSMKDAQRETNSGNNFKLRVDISGYNYMGAFLDGLIDIPVLNMRGFAICDGIARERKVRFGESPWVYGCFNDVDTSNLESFMWAFSCYMRGANGAVPWYNYATDDEYDHPVQTACLYPGNRFGLPGPAVSLRLKAARKCLELLKYIETFKRAFGYSDLQARAYVSQFIKMDGETISRFRDDAGIVRFSQGNTVEAIDALRRDLMRNLTAKKG